MVILPATLDDIPAILSLAIAAKMFLPEEVGPVRDVLENLPEGHVLQICADSDATPPIGVLYFGPNVMSDRTWDLWMIAVAPERQGQGIGRKLVSFAEEHVRANGGRLMLIESSSLPKYDATRAFYLKNGYTEVARVPDFYTDGDSKVIYSKRIIEKISPR